MFYKTVLIVILTTSFFYAESFKRVNPTPTAKMLENQSNAKVCESPMLANNEITDQFKYGCFCGKDYPKVDKESNRNFKDLTRAERLKHVESLFLIKPYDEIDAICQQHDICYLYQGKKAKVCNDAIYDELHVLGHEFRDANNSLKNQQCYHLSSDIASVFRTIFASADDEDTIFDAGMLFFNTSITIANKTFQEAIDTLINHDERYPEQKCISPK